MGVAVRKRIGFALLAVFVWSGVLVAQQPLAITRVLLYKNGMAYIVRSGEIAGPMRLTFHPEDMNDILKSFSAWNPNSGELYSVGYTTGIPSSYALARFPFDISDPNMGLGGFLIQVKGAEVQLDNREGRDVEGKLVAVQQEQRATAPQTSVSDYRLTVLVEDGSLETVWLGDVGSVEFADPLLRDQLRQYLAVLAEGRQDVTREVTVYPVPEPGPIQVSYLQQFPLWKASYRIDLADDEARVQGWAQIDNPTGESWDDVRVSLLSGAPVSFVMDLYAPLYTSRSVVPVPGGQVAAPRVYESAVSRVSPEPAAAAPPPAAVRGGVVGGQGGRGGGFAAPGSSAEVVADFANRSLVAGDILPGQQANAARVQDFFEYEFPFPVQLASRQSALLPFVQRTMEAERLSIFNANSDRENPRLGARIVNDTDVPLDAGPVTFYEDTRYAGESVLEYLPPGDDRFVSYGIDYDIQVARQAASRPERVARLTISDGIAVRYVESQVTTTYEIRNRGTEEKTLVIEHPRLPNRELTDVEPFETTESFYRFRVSLDEGEATELEIPEVTMRQTRLELTSLTRPQLVELFSERETPAEIRARLAGIVDTQERLAEIRQQLRITESQIASVFEDQERLRENLQALGTGEGDQRLRTRYLDQLTRQEDELDVARAAIDTLNAELAETQATLGEQISTLTFGG